MSTARWAIAIVLVLFLAAAGCYLVFFRMPAPVSPPPHDVPGRSQTYVSEKLGLRFQYVPDLMGTKVQVKESGNKVYLYAGSTTPEQGQSVELFSKDPGETFAASIRRQVLSGYSSSDCKVDVAPSDIQRGYQKAEISYPHPADENRPWFSNAPLCNGAYDQTNGIRYFLYDPARPNMFAFVDIGQYPLFGHDQIPWQDTLIFVR